jgi:tyrosinase
MTDGGALRVRKSLTDLSKKELEDLMRAWKGIQDLSLKDPKDPNGFFVIGGYHGEPFRGAGWGNVSYWGGYCNHGNVLFPTWHRAYLLRLEDALRSIPECENVTIPFWDECSQESLDKGIPTALTDEFFVFGNGERIRNPLRSYIFPREIVDHIPQDALPGDHPEDNPNYNGPNYSKPTGYETVRYPLSGLVGTPEDRKASAEHNKPYIEKPNDALEQLNLNVTIWLKTAPVIKGKPINGGHIREQYEKCLLAPCYTVFSNTTSRTEWNDHLAELAEPVVSLESPHNQIHLAVGGYYPPQTESSPDFSPIEGANGDMGENDTAALDPIFFFHHCFVDRVFWLWQKRHGFTKEFDITPGYPGTNSVDSQGPTPGTVPNSWLTMDSPLDPFLKLKDGKKVPYTSRDCIDIEQLGYTYGPGSLESPAALAAESGRTKTVRVRRINRAGIRGSFQISAYVPDPTAPDDKKKRHYLGTEAVLSRWHVEGCANCQAHLEAAAFFSLDRLPTGLAASVTAEHVEVEIDTRDGVVHTRDGIKKRGPTGSIAAAATSPEPSPYGYDVEVR